MNVPERFKGGFVKKARIKAAMEAMREIDQRVSEIADEDPLEALFILKNLTIKEGLNEKPLIAKIVLKLAEKLDFAYRQNYFEKAKIIKSLLVKLIDELEVKDIYDIVSHEYAGTVPGNEEFREELIDDTPLEECVTLFKNMK
jgi:hypothetical protein